MIKNRYAIAVFFLVVSSFGLLLYMQPSYRYWNDTIASLIMGPFLRLQHMVLLPVKKCLYSLELSLNQKKISELEQERDQLISEVIALQGSREFVHETQELIRYKQRYSMGAHILAHIVLKCINTFEHYIAIDQGSVHGVQKDMVAVYKNALIGRVSQVYPYWSKIVLITDPLCKVAIFFATTKASGIAEGICNTQSFNVMHVNHFDALKKGDYVISSGAGLVFPKGFGLGTVESFEKNGLFYTVRAKPLIAIDRIDYCYLIAKGTEL